MSEGRIWFGEPPTKEAFAASTADCMIGYVGIAFEGAGDDWLSASMPVDRRTKQPYGLLHGGASVVLAETLASMAAVATLDPARQTAVGLEINANHVRAAREGRVTGTARPEAIGRTVQVWTVRIVDERGKLVCTSRCTMAVIDRPGGVQA